MKILVTHDGRQHVNRLLIACEQRQWLRRFYTGFSANRFLPYLRWAPGVYKQLRRRAFTGVPLQSIRSFGVSFMLTRWFGEYRSIRLAYPLFDYWVAHNLSNESVDIVIGYENANRHTFNRARQLGKTTVLDLAQVHHRTIEQISSLRPVNELTGGQQDAINHRKQAALDLTDYILTLSSFARQSLVDNGIDPSRIYEVNLGIDIQNFTVVPKPKDGRFRVLFVGTITYRKGVDLLLQTFRNLALPNAELTLVGPISDGKDLLAQCTDTIRHVPFLHHDELVHYYQQADVFVFPSYLDSWAQVVLEAMACGTPVIVTENTGAKDAVAKGGGFIVPTGDERALAEKIKYFYDDRTDVERLGAEARRVAEAFTWEHYYQQLTDALTDIAQKEGIAFTD